MQHGSTIMLLEVVSALQGFLSALKINGRGNFRIHVDNVSVLQVFKKGNSSSGHMYLDLFLNALNEVARGTISQTKFADII